jgi:type VI secretion system secreted protein VgrG
MALLGRDTSVTGPFLKGVLLLETLRGQEALGRPYRFDLGLLSKDANLDPNDVLGKPLAVGIKLDTGDERFFHGIATKFCKTGTTQLYTRYEAILRPLLGLFNHTSDCRVFNDPSQDALAITTAVLAKRGLTDLESGALGDHAYRAREFCVQFRESDLNFVQRLLEDEGIYYFFCHEENKHTMVLADSISAHETVAGYESILYTAKERRVAGSDEHFWGMTVRRSLYPGRHAVVAGYDPTKIRPKQLQLGQAPSEEKAPGGQFEHYDHPGGLSDPEEARQEAIKRMKAARAYNTTIEVEGNTLGLGAGDLVSLRPGFDGTDVHAMWSEADFAKQYLIVSATYSISINQYETGDVAKKDDPIKAKYQLFDSHMQYRPILSARKPRMPGRQTALVVGPAGEEIWTDKFGRVMVQFDWDRAGERNEKSSCWIRVSQGWSGAKWGAQYLPRIGQEVIVAFLDGDPDRPIITGSLYNKDNLPPYELPANQSQSGIKSRSSKGGTASNFNELRFDDKKGQEELHMQAEKDMSTLVKHDQTLHVGADRTITVGNDEANHVKHDRSLWVQENDNVVVSGTHTKIITGAVTQMFGDNHKRDVTGEQEFSEAQNKEELVKQAYKLTTDVKFRLNQGPSSMTFAGSNVTVDSAGTITMTAGGATVCIDKTGNATFDSPTGIKLECGASSLTVLPGGIAIASPSVTAAAGAGSLMALGEGGAGVNSKTVTIEADGVCSVRGKSALKLQESEAVKAKKRESPKLPKEETDKADGSAPSLAARKGRGLSTANGDTPAPARKDATTDKDDTAREKGPLCIRIDMLPKHAEQVDARFVLTSSDQSIAITLTVRDDMEPGNETVDLLYKDLWKDLSYSLRIEENGEAAEVIFENVPYNQLASLVGVED